MNTKLLKISAVTASAALLASVFTGCAAEDSQKENNNYVPYDSNYNYEFIPEQNQNSDETNSAADKISENSPAEVNPNEEYSPVTEQGFKNPYEFPLSTFSADVDTASYANVRRIIEDAQAIPDGAVRVEEFINYFDYDYPAPTDGELFGRCVEIADCPWNSANKLMLVGIKAKEIMTQETPPSNLVFLIDASGSMAGYNKLPLVQGAFSMLAEELSENDRISIVTYANNSEIVLAGESGKNKDKILEALYSIKTGGNTNGEAGIRSAYELAEKCFINGGNNRVIIATDGDLNVGASTENELVSIIETKRESGIYLSVLGFGTDNIKDNKLEALADNGNGNYSYIDSVAEAERALVSEMKGNLYTVANDVKIQVEFNPSTVESYRLLGYDNRIMEAHDFTDSSKDAGEVGSGHTVTALYEISLKSSSSFDGIPLEFASEHTNNSSDVNTSARTELCKISVAYKDPASESAQQQCTSCLYGQECFTESPSDNFRLAGAAAEFAMLLKNSEYKMDSSYGQVMETINSINSENEKISELRDLVSTASALYK
ncbi:MAG: VWA domain-containing protein [Oscillospiraceae bacterium]|nr:VWA domain-containing protein [Oscillospiraceae bacterium]